MILDHRRHTGTLDPKNGNFKILDDVFGRIKTPHFHQGLLS